MSSSTAPPTFELNATYRPPPLMGSAADTAYQQELSASSHQAHLSAGVELIVRGLDRSSPYSAVQHLQRILQNLKDHNRMPNVTAVQPMREAAPTHPLDYAVVAFQGDYKANPRPDFMSAVGGMIRQLDGGLNVGWNIAPGYDKKRTVWFRDDHSLGIGELKRGLEAVFKSNHYDYQVCTANTASSPPRVTFQFLKKEHIDLLMRKPPIIKGHSFVPRIPRFIEPIYALEVAVVGVAPYNDPQMVIDRYLIAKYNHLAQEALIRSSRLALDDVVYCVVLETPEVAEAFVRDPFTAFEGLDVQPSKPEYLYILNQKGFPTQWQRSPPSSGPSDIHLQNQLDSVRNQQTVFQDTLTTLANRQQDMYQGFLDAQREMGYMFRSMISNVTYQNQLTSAQTELSSLQLTHTATSMMARLSDSDEFTGEMGGYARDVRRKITMAEQRVGTARQNLAASQIQTDPSMLPTAAFLQDLEDDSTSPPEGNRAGPSLQTALPGISQSDPPFPPGLPHPPANPPDDMNLDANIASGTSSPAQPNPKRKLTVVGDGASSSSASTSKRSRVSSAHRELMDVDHETDAPSQGSGEK
ncbi:hypothetical protein D9615_004612 [Tricholomella constricta]|uniref:Uncharacterized protein n=1 Tax=Tricholomella constricta TaxID=117010 RepID=A0A8H5HBU5_9AGAR|nr:hypothetical protein D9615_004612 [Tricholomella constricta]